MRKACLIITLLCASACSHRPAYTPYEEGYGYSDDELVDRVRVSRFVGNQDVTPRDAELFSHFRAIELCLERGLQFARFWGTTDRSTQVSMKRRSFSSYHMPSVVTAMASSTGYTGVWEAPYGPNRFGNASRWDQVFVYPSYDTAFTCANQSHGLGVSLQSVARDEMMAYTKDFQEGVRVDRLLTGSPNAEVLKPGDVVLKINDRRIRTLAQLGLAVDSAPQKSKLVLTVVRDGVTLTLKANAVDTTAEDRSRNQAIINQACALEETHHRTLCASRRAR